METHSKVQAVIETDALTRRYGDITAVDHLDLRIRRGEVYGFLGPNGAGKTTTLRMLLGLITPTSGRATVLGEAPGSAGSLLRTGAMIETPAFYPHLSGRNNLRVLAKYTGAPEARIDAVLDQVELLARADDAFSNYSLGMKQRLGVAAALLKDPELLILDEPTNGLDPAGMAEMRDLIRELGHGERTVLLSSHLMTEVEQVADRVGIIAKGRLVAEGTIDQLRGEDALLIQADPLDDARCIVAGMAGVRQVGDQLRRAADRDRGGHAARSCIHQHPARLRGDRRARAAARPGLARIGVPGPDERQPQRQRGRVATASRWPRAGDTGGAPCTLASSICCPPSC